MARLENWERMEECRAGVLQEDAEAKGIIF
jgi:hypothetical protein